MCYSLSLECTALSEPGWVGSHLVGPEFCVDVGEAEFSPSVYIVLLNEAEFSPAVYIVLLNGAEISPAVYIVLLNEAEISPAVEGVHCPGSC